MPTYKAPVEDAQFLLNDVFHVERYSNLPGFADATPDIVEAILGEAGKFCEQVLMPLYDVHWTRAVVVERRNIQGAESIRVGLLDGRVLPISTWGALGGY